MYNKYLQKFFDAPRPIKRAISVSYDLIAITFAYYLSYVLRLNTLDVNFGKPELFTVAATAITSVIFFIRTGLYRAILRYMPPQAILTIIIGILASSVVMISCAFFSHSFLPRSVPAIYIFVALILVGLPRLLFRNMLHFLAPKGNVPILIYGAGESAHQLVQQLHKSSQFRPIAFIDDNIKLHNNSIMGLRVHPAHRIPSLIKKHQVKIVLLALEGSYPKERVQIIRMLEPFSVQIQTIPPIADIINGKANISEFRDIQIEELLGREPVEPIQELLETNITNKVVMVTGAGGSIGSEICRQALKAKPSVLIIFERSEFNLYKINEELNVNGRYPDTKIIPILGSTNNRPLLDHLMKGFKVQTVFHAAAYKHVPLVENNIIEGINNNLFGTKNAAEAAISAHVQTFLLISSDKAVRPTNIMGASKRLAEMVLQGLANEQHTTRFSMVRFGNVLDSSGSVVPKFREQIKKGGPITVTHPEITRYFMTMSEAAQLVLQASALAKGGDVFVLEMGEPVKILNLAYEMAFLSGSSIKTAENPQGNIEIEFTGLRAGEKLYEELLIGNNCEGTIHPRIMRANEDFISLANLNSILSKLKHALDTFNHKEAYELITKSHTDFSAIQQLQDYLYIESGNNVVKLSNYNK
ncbi:MAG: polysaccharide biosynthesis protein [Gammaproteobacteria bacterium]|nr:MAG: polysaccharide biosynthesis protein [Gammaproteobacteria bacterium]